MNWLILIELVPILLGILIILFNKRILNFYYKDDGNDGSIIPNGGRKTRLIIIASILILFGLVGLIETL